MYIRFEPLVIKHAGIESTLIHAGRSSQDIHSTFHRTVLREQLLRFMQLALAARQSLLTKIRENFEVIVPNYTNGVAAQPNALAHQWLGHVQSFERDFRALAFAWQELNFSPWDLAYSTGQVGRSIVSAWRSCWVLTESFECL